MQKILYLSDIIAFIAFNFPGHVIYILPSAKICLFPRVTPAYLLNALCESHSFPLAEYAKNRRAKLHAPSPIHRPTAFQSLNSSIPKSSGLRSQPYLFRSQVSTLIPNLQSPNPKFLNPSVPASPHGCSFNHKAML